MGRGSIHSRFGPAGSAVLLASALLIWAGPAPAADAARGELLYDNHCKVCHTSVVHIREDRKARSREEIRTWVRRWSKELGLQWGPAEVDDVIEYLNNRYYKLESNS